MQSPGRNAKYMAGQWHWAAVERVSCATVGTRTGTAVERGSPSVIRSLTLSTSPPSPSGNQAYPSLQSPLPPAVFRPTLAYASRESAPLQCPGLRFPGASPPPLRYSGLPLSGAGDHAPDSFHVRRLRKRIPAMEARVLRGGAAVSGRNGMVRLPPLGCVCGG
eukprot:scaffold9936_cov130-Isochrysis_galbana.AAC.2